MLELTNPQIIKSILKKNHLWAQKKLGQNFLVARRPLITLMQTANITDDDIVVEIGPGLGTLTQELAKKAKLVLAIEKDYGYIEWLRQYFNHNKNVKIIHDDILTYNLSLITYPSAGEAGNYKIVSNLPYNITSPVIRKFLEAGNKPSEMILTVQKEVAERICAKPGDSDRGILTVMVEFYGAAEIIEIVDRSCFWPIPKVDSAIIKLKIKNYPLCADRRIAEKLKIDEKLFFRLVKAGFSSKRRQIHNSLSGALRLSKDKTFSILKIAGIDQNLRAEDLSLDNWLNLYRIITK